MTPRLELALDLALRALDEQSRRMTGQRLIYEAFARGEVDRMTINAANRSVGKAIERAAKAIDFLISKQEPRT